MSENNYGAMMMKAAVGISDDINAILSPGIYIIPAGNTTSPDSGGGVLIVYSGSPVRRIFVSESVITLTSTRNGTSWSAWRGALSRTNPFADIKSDGAIIQALSNLGISPYIQGVLDQEDQWDTWTYLGLVDALNSKQQADATLSALADLTTSANKLPYFSGVDKMSITDLTAFARGLLGKADAATAKGHLGVGSAGGRNVGIGFSSGGSEIPDMTFFGGLKGAAGYQYSPTGMLLQWGIVTLNSMPSGTSIGKFPVAFPVAGQQIIVTHDNPLASTLAFGAASIIDPSSFRVNAIAIDANNFTMVPGHALTLRWIAIGS